MKNFVILAALVFVPLSSNAGIYTDDLSRCLVEKTTIQDKDVFVKWMFTALSFHPTVEDNVSFSPKDVDEANKNMAHLIVEMLTDRCLDASKKAIKYEGQASLQSAFTIFGQVAGQELMGHPKVGKSLSGFDKHIDSDFLNSKLGME